MGNWFKATDSIINIGNNNTVVNVQSTDVDWSSLENDLLYFIEHLSDNEKDLEILKRAYSFTNDKDQRSLKNLIREHASFFTSNMFSNAAGAFLTEFIKKTVS